MNSLSAPYQHFLSNPIAKPPCRMHNANMYGFFAEIESNKAQKYIDSTLNIGEEGNIYFKILGEFALITFTDIEKIASMTPPFDQHGWMQETDIIIWLPVAKVEDEDITYLYWYPAFICVNNIYALINGRETWGYNKYLCDYTMPSCVSELSNFSISLECFEHFSPESKLQMHELFSITINSKHQDSDFLSIIDNFGDQVANLFSRKHLDIDFSLLKQLLSGFVFLKPEFTLHLNKLDSFPLADMFGLKLGSQALHLPFYVQMDFDQLAATKI